MRAILEGVLTGLWGIFIGLSIAIGCKILVYGSTFLVKVYGVFVLILCGAEMVRFIKSAN